MLPKNKKNKKSKGKGEMGRGLPEDGRSVCLLLSPLSLSLRYLI